MKAHALSVFRTLTLSCTLLLAAPLWAANCSPELDAEYTRSMVGTWGKEPPPVQMESPFQQVYHADGTYTLEGRQPGYGENGLIMIRGTWKVENCRLTETATHSNEPRVDKPGAATTTRLGGIRLETIDEENGKPSIMARQLRRLK